MAKSKYALMCTENVCYVCKRELERLVEERKSFKKSAGIGFSTAATPIRIKWRMDG